VFDVCAFVNGKSDQLTLLCLCPPLLRRQVLDLAGNDLTVEGAPEVAKSLESLPALRRLVLSENELQDQGTALIAAALPGATR